jgi:glycosyltransferase involved in cell wall biosynthesis
MTAPVNTQPTAEGSPSMLIVATVPGTITSFLLPYAEHLRRRGWRVDAATSAAPDARELSGHVDRLWYVPWSRSSLDPRNLTSALAATRRLLRAGRYDVVHTHTPVSSLIVRLAVASLRRRSRPTVVYTAHGFHFGASERDGPAEWLFARFERLAGRWTDLLIVINGDDLATARRLRLVAPERLRLLPGIGVDLDWYRPTAQVRAEARAHRAALGLVDDDTLLAMLAAFEPRKNHGAVLQALAQLDRADLHVAFAGAGPLERALRAQAEQLGVADRVHFLAVVGDVRPLIAASAATLLPSFREGLSRAVLESLAMGVPVVGSRVRGIAELVEPGGGVLVAPNDADALAAAIEKTVDAPAACFDGPAIRARLEPYSIEHLLCAHDGLYNELLVQRRSERNPV